MQTNGIGPLVRQFVQGQNAARFAERERPRVGAGDAWTGRFKNLVDTADFSQSAIDLFERLKDFLGDIIESLQSRDDGEVERDDASGGTTYDRSGTTLFFAFYYVETTVVATFDASA